MGNPTIHPTGVTIYDPQKCYNGYTIFQANEHGAVLMDMNGGVVSFWEKLQGFPNKLLPGGQVLGSLGERAIPYGHQDQSDLVQVDWDGNIVWEFDHLEYIKDPEQKPQWMARQHHDYQREGNPVGYYVPGCDAKIADGNTLLLCHHNVVDKRISLETLVDDCIIEIDWQGQIVWRWNCHEHFSEYEFSDIAKNAIARCRAKDQCGFDWMHINCMSVLGPNQWYDAGDERFHPDNIIWDSRQANILAIISKKTGKVVWKLGPDYTDKAYRWIGQIIGPHHTHMIPRGLPGEGHILVFDNGGWGGYGLPDTFTKTGERAIRRDYSRVLEIDPVQLKIVWQFTPSEMGHAMPFTAHHFYSPFISSAQRLPNGNTLITEGSGGRVIEVTPEHEVVWEYVSPYWGKEMPLNMIYRAYRYPYDYVPQIIHDEEVAIERVDVTELRMPGAKGKAFSRTAHVPGVWGYGASDGFCVEKEEVQQ